MPLLGEFIQIHELLPHLSLLGQIFKFDNDYGESMLLGEIPDPSTAETCLKKISQDQRLCERTYVARDEGAKIYMVAGKVAGENRYYEIEFESIDFQCQDGVTWKWGRFGSVPVDGFDESFKELGGWMNPALCRKTNPFILIPRLGKETDGAIFRQAISEVICERA